MRATIVAVMLALGLAGCGGDDDDKIDGDWSVAINSACGYGMTLKKSAGTYEWGFLCSLQGGGFGVEYDSGTTDFSVPGKITFHAKQASCPSITKEPVTVAYSFSDDNHLSLVFPSAAFQFERDTSGDSTGVIRFGCWENELFTDSPIKDL